MSRKAVIFAATFVAGFNAAQAQAPLQLNVIPMFVGLLCDSPEHVRSVLQKLSDRPASGAIQDFLESPNCTVLPPGVLPHIKQTIGSVEVGGKTWDLVEIKIVMTAHLSGRPFVLHVPLISAVSLYSAVPSNVHASDL